MTGSLWRVGGIGRLPCLHTPGFAARSLCQLLGGRGGGKGPFFRILLCRFVEKSRLRIISRGAPSDSTKQAVYLPDFTAACPAASFADACVSVLCAWAFEFMPVCVILERWIDPEEA